MATFKKFNKDKRPKRNTQSLLFKRKRFCRFTVAGVEEIDYKDIDTLRDFLSENGKRAYREYLTKMTPRAFAVSPSGAWCWAEEGEDPEARALATCSAKSDKPCRLYSVDEHVVWNPDLAEKAAVTASNTPAPATPGDGAVGNAAGMTAAN